MIFDALKKRIDKHFKDQIERFNLEQIRKEIKEECLREVKKEYGRIKLEEDFCTHKALMLMQMICDAFGIEPIYDRIHFSDDYMIIGFKEIEPKKPIHKVNVSREYIAVHKRKEKRNDTRQFN